MARVSDRLRNTPLSRLQVTSVSLQRMATNAKRWECKYHTFPPDHQSTSPLLHQTDPSLLHELNNQVPKEEASSHLVTLPDEGDPLENHAVLTGAADAPRGAAATAAAAAFQARWMRLVLLIFVAVRLRSCCGLCGRLCSCVAAPLGLLALPTFDSFVELLASFSAPRFVVSVAGRRPGRGWNIDRSMDAANWLSQNSSSLVCRFRRVHSASFVTFSLESQVELQPAVPLFAPCAWVRTLPTTPTRQSCLV